MSHGTARRGWKPMHGAALALALALAALGGCRPPKTVDSRAASLDNFARDAGATVHTNVCGIEAPLDRRYEAAIKPTGSPLTADVLRALSAVPESIKNPFFRLNGRIEIRADAAAVCGRIGLSAADRSFASENTTTVETCWLQPAPGQPPVIYLPANAPGIRHGLLRTFAYVYVEFFVDRLTRLDKDAKKPDAKLRAALQRHTDARDGVGQGLIDDVKKMHASSAARLEAMRKRDKGRFDDLAVVEAIDSYYCSPATNGQFEVTFAKTFAAFAHPPKGKPALAVDYGAPAGFKAD